MRVKVKIGMASILIVIVLFSMIPAISAATSNDKKASTSKYRRDAKLLYINGMEIDLRKPAKVPPYLQAKAPSPSEPGYFIIQLMDR